MAAAAPLSKLLDLCEQFVQKHNGRWNHDDWEELLGQAAKTGLPFDQDECKRNLGNILEACKYFYEKSSGEGAAPAKKKPAAKKKASS